MVAIKRRMDGAIERIEADVIEVGIGESVFAQATESAAVDAVEAWALGGTYRPGDVRARNGKLWEYIGASQTTALDPNWAPGIAWSLWRETWASGVIPDWRQPQGAHDAYTEGFEVLYLDRVWVSQIPANTTVPGSDVRWWVLAEGQEPLEPDVPAWVQPTGAHDAYKIDAKVTHKGKTWRSLVNANVWEPGGVGTASLWIEIPT